MDKYEVMLVYKTDKAMDTLYYYKNKSKSNTDSLFLIVFDFCLFPTLNFKEWNKEYQHEQIEYVLSTVGDKYNNICIDSVKIK